MNSHKTSARITGVLFLTAMVASLLGGGLLETLFDAPDYLISVSANTTQGLIGIFLELMNAIAVAGIAMMMFPVIKMYNEQIAVGYFGFRIIESIFCILAAIIPQSIISLSQEFLQAGASDAYYFQALGAFLLTARANIAGILIPLFFSLGALLLYYVLYQSKLIPRFISVWGFIGVVLVIILNVFKVESMTGMILALPIILNEIFLGIWLIVKGFNSSEVASVSA